MEKYNLMFIQFMRALERSGVYEDAVKLENAFNELVGGKTAIYISHRLSSCKFCDKIAVFAEDCIKEYGTHAELLKKLSGSMLICLQHRQGITYKEIGSIETGLAENNYTERA